MREQDLYQAFSHFNSPSLLLFCCDMITLTAVDANNLESQLHGHSSCFSTLKSCSLSANPHVGNGSIVQFIAFYCTCMWSVSFMLVALCGVALSELKRHAIKHNF